MSKSEYPVLGKDGDITMNHNQLMALATEFAKNLKTDADLNEFGKALKKLTVETALNAELTEYLGHERNQQYHRQRP